ncbi:signal peptidase II [Novosphingobium sp. G106]|uniref:signal peptidase II n=1 Tax=Novosphingobium sp. G106 TaxID=2849500 RepID=UPI001C2D6958|nr:signal peptidase II [Novosphingobium sp. G106]MBV1690135.1 signal peptidase II [Novosphingobium sp. G106]
MSSAAADLPAATLWRRRIAALVLAGLVYAIDQWIKRQVAGAWGVAEASRNAGRMGIPDAGVSVGLPFFKLTWTENYGVSLGMLTAQSIEMRYLLVALTSLIALVVFVWIVKYEKAKLDLAALALVLGGALGNIHDRAWHGYVVDYADFHIGEWRPFLIFNLADAAITVGVLIILARSLFSREKPKPAEIGPADPEKPADTAPES